MKNPSFYIRFRGPAFSTQVESLLSVKGKLIGGAKRIQMHYQKHFCQRSSRFEEQPTTHIDDYIYFAKHCTMDIHPLLSYTLMIISL